MIKLLTDEAIKDIERKFYNKYSCKGMNRSEVVELHSSEFFENVSKAQALSTLRQVVEMMDAINSKWYWTEMDALLSDLKSEIERLEKE